MRFSGMSRVLDIERLRRVANGDTHFEKRLLSLFEITIEKCLADLENTQDTEMFHHICHELKGAAANLGAERIAALCNGAVDHVSSSAARAEIITTLRKEKEALHTFLLAARRDAV